MKSCSVTLTNSNQAGQKWSPQGERVGHIDADLMVYSASSKYETSDTFEPIQEYLDECVVNLVERLDLDDFTLYVTAGGNFRKEVYSEYKANRRKKDRPRWLGECYRYLYDYWAAQATRTYEADDLLGIAVTADPCSILISYDKDLDQVPGWHYNWYHDREYHVTPLQGDRFLATQLLVGDRTDNIKGAYNIGPKKAEKILHGIHGLDNLLNTCLEVYRQQGNTVEEFTQNYKCLKILRTPAQTWPELEGLIND